VAFFRARGRASQWGARVQTCSGVPILVPCFSISVSPLSPGLATAYFPSAVATGTAAASSTLPSGATTALLFVFAVLLRADALVFRAFCVLCAFCALLLASLSAPALPWALTVVLRGGGCEEWGGRDAVVAAGCGGEGKEEGRWEEADEEEAAPRCVLGAALSPAMRVRCVFLLSCPRVGAVFVRRVARAAVVGEGEGGRGEAMVSPL